MHSQNHPTALHTLIRLSFLLITGCASVGTPSGGPKDKTPPTLLSSTPKDKQTNFSGKQIELTFDEAIKLSNPKEEIIISPSPGKNLDITAKGNRVIIKPENPWATDITYSIQFRDGIQDLNEGNIPPNLKLAFSTGPLIDSLHITGRITDILKGTAVDKATVALYSSDTFNIFTDTPIYFTKTNKHGQYTIDNLHPGDYYIYAFQDNNKNLKVDSKSESHGFMKEKINLLQNQDSIRIGLFRLDTRKLKLITARHNGIKTIVRLTKAITEYAITSPLEIAHSFGDNAAEISVYGTPPPNDSVQVRLQAKDSLQSTLDTTFFLKQNKVNTKPEKLKWSLGEPAIDLESATFTTAIQTSKLISNLLPDSLYIRIDSVTTIPFNKDDIQADPIHRTITLRKNIDKSLFTQAPSPAPLLIAGIGLLTSMEGDTSKHNEIKIKVIKPEDTGTVLVETKTTEKNYIIQLITPDGKIAQAVRNLSKYTFKNVIPGDYQIRIIHDINNNGKWDPGNYFTKEEPEKITYYHTSTRQTKFPIRANWELGPLTLTF